MTTKLTKEQRDVLGLKEGEELPAAADKRLHPILTNEELATARAEAEKRVLAARHKAAYDRAISEEEDRLRREEGLTTGDPARDEPVWITIDLPTFTPYLMVNGPMGKIYWHGKSYKVARHVADSLSEMIHRAWREEDQMEGRDLLTTYRRRRESAINAARRTVHNAPTRMSAEPTGPI